MREKSREKEEKGEEKGGGKGEEKGPGSILFRQAYIVEPGPYVFH